MAEFQTFSLGDVLSTAENINSARRQSKLDELREIATRQQIDTGKAAAVREQTQFDENTRLANTQWLANATDQVLAITDPAQQMATAQTLGNEAKRRGIIPGDVDLSKINMEGLAQLNRDAKLSLAPEKADPRIALDQSKFKYQQEHDAEQLKLERQKLAQAGRDQAASKEVSKQLVTRPVGNGLVQDFAWNPKTNERVPSGEPYRPVTPHTGNVTEGERKAAALATRLESALQTINAAETAAPGSSKPGVLETVVGAVGEPAANVVRSPERRQANAAQLDALDAALTLATGAAYTREQLKGQAVSYFPQIGDDDATKASKAARFDTLLESARIAAGRAEPFINKALEASPPVPDMQGGGRGTPSAGAAPRRVSSPQEARSLPPGTRFVTPDGRVKVR